MTKPSLSPAGRLEYLKRLQGVLLFLLLPGVFVAGVLYTKGEQIILGAEAYIFGYPLVLMDATRANAALTLAPENTLHRVRQFPTLPSGRWSGPMSTRCTPPVL